MVQCFNCLILCLGCAKQATMQSQVWQLLFLSSPWNTSLDSFPACSVVPSSCMVSPHLQPPCHWTPAQRRCIVHQLAALAMTCSIWFFGTPTSYLIDSSLSPLPNFCRLNFLFWKQWKTIELSIPSQPRHPVVLQQPPTPYPYELACLPTKMWATFENFQFHLLASRMFPCMCSWVLSLSFSEFRTQHLQPYFWMSTWWERIMWWLGQDGQGLALPSFLLDFTCPMSDS